MRLQKKSISKVSLLDLLRRRKSSLEKFLEETGIVTYELLVKRCESSGMMPPSETQFLKAKGNPLIPEVSSPSEGIVVVKSPDVIRTTHETGPIVPIPLDTIGESSNSKDDTLEVEAASFSPSKKKKNKPVMETEQT